MPLYTEPDNVSDAIGLFQYANDVSSGVLGIGIPVSVSFIVFFILLLNETPKSNAFTASAIVYTILAMILSWAGMINLLFVIGGILLVAFGAMWMKAENSN
jgi:hypothetical protein